MNLIFTIFGGGGALLVMMILAVLLRYNRHTTIAHWILYVITAYYVFDACITFLHATKVQQIIYLYVQSNIGGFLAEYYRRKILTKEMIYECNSNQPA